MLISSRIKFALFAWMVLEILAFSLVAHWIGAPRAILLGVITSLLGLTLLRRAGTSALMKLRGSLGDRPLAEGSGGRFLDEMLATVGALALLLPGFLSDLVGLALAIPALRERAARRLAGKSSSWFAAGSAPRRGPSTIDLDPEDWRRSDPSRPMTKSSS